MKFWQAWRNFVPKNTKKFPELQECWSYNFSNKFIFFIKIDSLATENAILTTVANKFLWESTDIQLGCRKPPKKLLTFPKENNFPKNVPMYMYNAVVTTLPKFYRQNSENFLLEFPKIRKSDVFSKKPICQIFHLNMYNKVLTSLP